MPSEACWNVLSQGLGFRVQSLGFEGLRFWVLGLGFKDRKLQRLYQQCFNK